MEENANNNIKRIWYEDISIKLDGQIIIDYEDQTYSFYLLIWTLKMERENNGAINIRSTGTKVIAHIAQNRELK